MIVILTILSISAVYAAGVSTTTLGYEDSSAFKVGGTDNSLLTFEPLDPDQLYMLMKKDPSPKTGSFNMMYSQGFGNVKTGFIGILFRYQDKDNFYMLQIDNTFKARIIKKAGGNATQLTEWVTFTNKASWWPVDIAGTLSETQVSFTINKMPVGTATIQAPGYSTFKYGFLVSGGAEYTIHKFSLK